MLGNSNQQGTILLVTAIIITLVSGLILEPRDRAWYPRALIEGDDARHLRTGGALGRDEWRDGMSVGFRAPARFYTSNWRDKAIDGSQQHQKRRMDRQLAYIVSPLSNQILEVGESLGPNRGRSIDLFAGYREEPVLSGGPLNECLTLRSSVQLAKDDVDKESGQIKRSCKGTVQVNRCEGSCSSSVQPSVRSHVGLKKVSETLHQLEKL